MASGDYLNLHIPVNRDACANAWGNGINLCPAGDTTLTKLLSSQLHRSKPAVAALLGAVSLTDPQVQSLLRRHPESTLSAHNTTRSAACSWLREHEPVWSGWLERAWDVATLTKNVTIGVIIPESMGSVSCKPPALSHASLETHTYPRAIYLHLWLTLSSCALTG